MTDRMEILARCAPELGIELNGEQLEQFEVYYRELADWNERMNLTSVIEYSEVQVKAFSGLPDRGAGHRRQTGAGNPGC